MKTHFHLLLFLILLQSSTVIAQKSQPYIPADSLKQKLFSTRYYIDKKEVDSLTFKSKERELIAKVSDNDTIKSDSVSTDEIPANTNKNQHLSVKLPARKFVPYNQLNDIYSWKDYKYQRHDHYIPWLNATTSLLIPGTGQIITGDILRGGIFLGVEAASFMSIIYGALENWGSGGKSGMFWVYAGTAGMIATPIWSAVDSYRVSAVRNLYLRDRKQYKKLHISILPYYRPVPYSVSKNTETGLAVNLRF